jgi:predicted ATPase
VQLLRLEALAYDNADEMLTAMLGESETLLPLKQLIIETTGGTPFFSIRRRCTDEIKRID